MNRYLLVLLFTVFSLSLMGQRLREFSSEHEVFLTELQGYLEEVSDKQSEPLYMAFSSSFLSDFSADEQDAIIEIGNQLLRRRVSDWRSWNCFLLTTLELLELENNNLRLPWMEHFTAYVKDHPNRLTSDYIYTTYLNFSDSLISDTRGIQWMALNGDKVFSFDGKPVFTYTDADLYGFFKDDSTLIELTRITFSPDDMTLHVEGGRVFFNRAGLSRDTAFADLKSAVINADQPGFKADSVTLTNILYLTEPIEGEYEERMSSLGNSRSAVFPRFESYRRDIVLDNIVPEVNFRGGFRMTGNKFFGSGSEDNPSRLTFFYEGNPLVEVYSDRFRLRPDVLGADEAQLSILLKEDSIHHPSIQMRFIVEEKKLNLYRPNDGLSRAPISNTFHNLDMYFEC
jgi:hypothetical protein